ncbi:MAG: NusG domain II-containing protein [Treponema sp.]
MKVVRSLRIGDMVIFAVLVVVILLAGIALYGNTEQSGKLIVQTPSGTWVYPLNIPQTIKLPGARGMTEIRIENNSARIVSSACPNKTCMAAPALKKQGDWNACLPNKVFLHIEETGDTAVLPARTGVGH